MDLLLGEDPLALAGRVALLDEVLLDFEASHPEPLAALNTWKQNGLRSYLLIRGELVKATWLLGEREAALEEQAMLLELDPGNHFFQREQMLAFLMAMEDWESLETELDLGHKGRKESLLRRLMYLAISLAKGARSEAKLQYKALQISHPRAVDFWSGKRELPIEIPVEAEEGSREESMISASFLRPFTPQRIYAPLRALAAAQHQASGATVTENAGESRNESSSSPGTPSQGTVSTQQPDPVREQLARADSSASDPERRLHHLRQALRRAEARIDPATFARCRGQFSDKKVTAQYLEVLLRLGLTLFETGKVEEARAHLGRMLDLDKADAFGARAYLDGMRKKKTRSASLTPDRHTHG